MRFILYFIFFYLFYRILRRLIAGPKPRRSFYVNFGTGGVRGNADGAGGPFQGYRNASAPAGDDEPMVGGRPKTQPRMEEKQRVRDIQDAEFKEIE